MFYSFTKYIIYAAMDGNLVLMKVLVLFILIIIGYAARHLNVFSDDVTRGLNGILIKITLPALILASLQKEFSQELLVLSFKLLAISFAVYGFCFLLALIMPFFLRPRHAEKGVFQFIIMFSNVGFMGFPILSAIFGEEALFYASIYNLPFNLLTFTLGVYLLVKNSHNDFKFAKEHILNPGVFSVIIGFLLFIFSVKLPVFIGEPIKLLGDTTIPLSMFLIGAMLRKGKLHHIFMNWRIYIISIIRLIAIPFILYFTLRNFISDRLFLGVIVIIAAMPAAASAPILAEEFGGSSEIAAQGVFISTLLSVVTIPLISLLFIS